MREATQTRVRVDVRAWPHVPSIAHLVLLDVTMVPAAVDIDGWVRDLLTSGSPSRDAATGRFEAIRTGALSPRAAEAFADRGFVEVDRLALLERSLPPTDRPAVATAVRGVSLRRMRTRDLDDAARIDASAFEPGWRNDARSLDDIRRATPNSRGRIVRLGDRPTGFALTGRSGSTGYLQRIAVSPAMRRRGVARLLVDDAVRWLIRRGATTAFVNTGVDNRAALALYDGCGFRRRADELVVMEFRR